MLSVAPITLERIMVIEESHYGVCLQCGKASHLVKKLLLPGLPGCILYKLDMQDLQKSDC